MWTVFLLSQFLVPLSDPSQWLSPTFGSLKRNQVSFEADGLQIRVQDSSSPLFLKLPEVFTFSCLSIDGHLSGLPNLGQKNEGQKGADDFAIRIGLVSPGERPGWFYRLFLPQWVRTLLEVDSERGFSSVHFFNISQTLPIGEKREHPSLKNIFEEMSLQMKHPGAFGFTKEIRPPIPTCALWIQSDGDDTHSTFSVKLKKMILCQ